MAEEMYTQRAYDSSFMDLKDDKDFQVDLVRFFSGGRYNMSREEMEEVGMDGLTEKFVEHMRVQGWNEVTQAKDLNYLLNKDLHRKGKESFAPPLRLGTNVFQPQGAKEEKAHHVLFRERLLIHALENKLHHNRMSDNVG